MILLYTKTTVRTSEWILKQQKTHLCFTRLVFQLEKVSCAILRCPERISEVKQGGLLNEVSAIMLTRHQELSTNMPNDCQVNVIWFHPAWCSFLYLLFIHRYQESRIPLYPMHAEEWILVCQQLFNLIILGISRYRSMIFWSSLNIPCLLNRAWN